MIRDFLALLIVAGMIGLIGALFVFPVPDSDLFKIVASAYVTGGFSTIIGYYFGSSSGSKDKDEVIGAALAKARPEIATVEKNNVVG